MHVATAVHGLAPDVWSAVTNRICDYGWKIDFGKLHEVGIEQRSRQDAGVKQSAAEGPTKERPASWRWRQIDPRGNPGGALIKVWFKEFTVLAPSGESRIDRLLPTGLIVRPFVPRLAQLYPACSEGGGACCQSGVQVAVCIPCSYWWLSWRCCAAAPGAARRQRLRRRNRGPVRRIIPCRRSVRYRPRAQLWERRQRRSRSLEAALCKDRSCSGTRTTGQPTL